jgi:hypothetical protein
MKVHCLCRVMAANVFITLTNIIHLNFSLVSLIIFSPCFYLFFIINNLRTQYRIIKYLNNIYFFSIHDQFALSLLSTCLDNSQLEHSVLDPLLAIDILMSIFLIKMIKNYCDVSNKREDAKPVVMIMVVVGQ